MTDRVHFLSRTPASSLTDWDALPFLEKVTSVAPGIIYVFNQQTQSNEYSNHSLGQSLGYTNDEIREMGAALMPTLIHPDDQERVFAHFALIQQLQDGEIAQVEYRMQHRDGDWVWLASHDSVFDRDADGTVIRHIGVATDITGQKQAEAEAQREKQAADDANDELRSFAYSVSHDLKSPSITLGMLLSEIQTSVRDGDKDDATELLASAQKTVLRMKLLIDDVLHYTQVIGNEHLENSVDLNVVFEGILEDLHGEIEESSCTISADPLPTLRGDPMQLRILFQNLVSNAIRYRLPDVAPIVSISWKPGRRNRTATISVTDNGIGIDPAMQHRIFRMFTRLHGETDYPGTGLGLATCRRVVSNHHGKIFVKSKPGEGATFSVTLPM